MNNTAVIINELNPIAATLRDREEQISGIKRDVLTRMGEGLGLMAEQGRDITLAKTKLGKAFRWGEWLRIHVPNLPEGLAGKYERIANEQLADPRQCVFAFLPPNESTGKADEPRLNPAAWETALGYVGKLRRTLRDSPITQWPEEQRRLAASELEPLARVLWPERF
jgi:hypothetical protein